MGTKEAYSKIRNASIILVGGVHVPTNLICQYDGNDHRKITNVHFFSSGMGPLTQFSITFAEHCDRKKMKRNII